MPVEIEAKIKVDDFAAVRANLAEHHGVRVKSVVESNAFFDTEDRSLQAADKGLRVRSARNAADGSEECTATFKGPRMLSALKSRHEIEVSVNDFAAAVELLKALGFVQVLLFEKRRETWVLAGCKVELDELPLLGCYVEIEGPNETTIRVVQQALGLGTRPNVKTAYVGLLISHLQDLGVADRTVRFDQE